MLKALAAFAKALVDRASEEDINKATQELALAMGYTPEEAPEAPTLPLPPVDFEGQKSNPENPAPVNQSVI